MGKKSTQTTNNEPPRWAKPLFEQSAQEASRLYDSGSGFNVWEGQTIADPSSATSQGLQGLKSVASDPSLQNLSGSAVSGAQNVIGSGGWNPQTSSIYNFLSGAAGGGLNADTSGLSRVRSMNSGMLGAMGAYGNAAAGGLNSAAGQGFAGMFNQGGNPLASEINLQDTASGKYVREGNPYERAVFAQNAQDIADSVSQQFSGAGRYGSGAHQGVLAEEQGDYLNKAYSDAFNRERGLQMQANQMLDAAQGQRFGQGLSALQGLLGADTANAQTQLAGAGGLLNAGSNIFGNQLQQQQALFDANAQNASQQLAAGQAAGQTGQQALDTQLNYTQALPTTMQSSLFAPTAALQAGTIEDQMSQAQLNDDIRRFYENDMNEWTRLGALQAAAGGAAGPYGTSVTTTRQPFNPFGMLGGLMSFF